MTDSSLSNPPSAHRFSLAQLMLCVLIAGLFLGIVRLAFPDDFVAAYILILGGMTATLGILALVPVGKS